MKKSLKALSILTAACLFAMPASEAMAYDSGKADSVNQKTLVSTEEAQKDVKISKDKAKETGRNILKDYFNVVIDEKNYNNSISLNARYNADGKGYDWDMSWSMQNNDKNVAYNVSIDADTGKTINADIENNDNDNAAVTITESEAKVIAENFLKKVNPEDFKQTKLKEDNDWTRYGSELSNYTFTYIRYANNIPFQDNSLFVKVNGAAGKVSSYGCTWNQNIKFPEVSGYVSSDKALSLFKNNMTMQLHYVLCDDSCSSKYTNDNPSKQIRLMYMPAYSNGNTLNAITGRFDDNGADKTENKNLTDKEREEFYKKYKAASKTDKDVDKSTAQSIMAKIIKEFYGDGYTISEINYYENNQNDYDANNKKQWQGNFKKGNEKDKNTQNVYISIDASNGALISINNYSNNYGSNKDIKSAITWEQAYYKAINAVAEYFPDKVKSIETLQTRTINADETTNKLSSRYIGFDFQREENGAIYDSNNISVNFDVSDGSIRDISSYWSDDIKFTDTKGIITDKTAQEDYFKNNNPELCYTEYNKSNDYQNPQYEIRLSYVLQNDNYLNSYIDALSGKRMTYNGEEIDENIESFLQNIKGDKYEKELFILARQGIIDTNNFNENKEVTKIDLIKMLVNMKGYKPYMVSSAADLKLSGMAKGSADYKYLQMAVAYGIIEDKEGAFDPSLKVTREEMVKSIIKLLGYEKLASNSDIFAVDFKDSSKIDLEYKGAAAIAKGLGLIDGDNFRPKDNATMIELAITAYKALGNFRD